MRDYSMLVQLGGAITTIGDPLPEIASLGTVQRKRISHIRPVDQPKRALFILLRRLFGDRGRVAAWTRTWEGPWEVQFIHQPEWRCAVFFDRNNAVDWELTMAEELFIINHKGKSKC
jgi:hypothetical protein